MILRDEEIKDGLHDLAGKLELQDAIFVRHVANRMLPLVPVVEEQ